MISRVPKDSVLLLLPDLHQNDGWMDPKETKRRGPELRSSTYWRIDSSGWTWWSRNGTDTHKKQKKQKSFPSSFLCGTDRFSLNSRAVYWWINVPGVVSIIRISIHIQSLPFFFFFFFISRFFCPPLPATHFSLEREERKEKEKKKKFFFLFFGLLLLARMWPECPKRISVGI